MPTLPELLELRLRAACGSTSDTASLCSTAAWQHLAAGGGRVRSQICLDASVRLGLSHGNAVCAAAVCELIHNASLIQDDLLDRTPSRRQKPSVWVEHGDTVAVCTGDLMLSAAYGLISELDPPSSIAPALRLVHRRTSEVIVGQTEEIAPAQLGSGETALRYERLARAKSASLLSLSLELPLLLSGNEMYLAEANAVAGDFAVAYQIADDLADVLQDAREGSLNLMLSLVEQDGLTRPAAYAFAINLATARLASAQKQAAALPNDCAASLLALAEKLRQTLAAYSSTSLVTAGV